MQQKKKKKTDQMKEPKNYMFFLLGSYHWFMYLTFLLVTVQFQVCLLGQNKENFKSRRQIDNSTVIWCGHWSKWLVKCYLAGLVNSSLKMSTEISWKCSVTFLLLNQDSVKMERGVAPPGNFHGFRSRIYKRKFPLTAYNILTLGGPL